MTKSARTNKNRTDDRKLTEKEFDKECSTLLEKHFGGKSHWCIQKESQIQPKVCDKFQSTAGCPTGPAKKSDQTGCACWVEALNMKATKKSKKKSGGPVKESYQTIISKYLFENGVARIEDLVEAINSNPTRSEVKRLADAKNTSVGVSILRNPTRTKNPLNIKYSRISKIYY